MLPLLLRSGDISLLCCKVLSPGHSGKVRSALHLALPMSYVKYHDTIEVLEPETLRDDIIDKAWCILDLYGEHTPGSDFVE